MDTNTIKSCCGGTTTDMKENVRRHYAAAAQAALAGGPSSCCSSGSGSSCYYEGAALRDIPASAVQASLGCGNPTLLAQLHPGERVLDLGSGGGIDVLLSARRVGPAGFAYGVDMTDEMLELARKNQAEAGLTNVAFLKGDIENLPLPDGSVDVVISNCVINLSLDKDRVFREIFRVLRPGGRMAVSDMVFTRPAPAALRNSDQFWSACVAGSLTVEEYRAKMEAAGFSGVSLEITRELGLGIATVASASIKGRKPGIPFASTDLSLRETTPATVTAAEELLVSAGLPLDGLKETYLTVAEIADRGVAGVAGFEQHGPYALLRSVAVRREFRSQGLGKMLVETVLAKARAAGATKVYLLTDSAEGYYARLGWRRIARTDLPAELNESAEVRDACPVSAATMVLEG